LHLIRSPRWMAVWWISNSLRVNTTELLEAKWLRFLARELYEHGKQQEQNLQRSAFHRVPTMKLIRKAMTLEQLRAIQGKRWRLLMDPRFRRRVERSLRRRQERHRRTCRVVCVHLYQYSCFNDSLQEVFGWCFFRF
jgi:hypothetical protein